MGGRKEEEGEEVGEDEEVERMVKAYQEKGGKLWGRGVEREKEEEEEEEEIEDDSKGMFRVYFLFVHV